MIAPLVLAAGLAGAQLTDPTPPSVKRLHDDFVEAIDEAPRAGIIESVARTAPATPADIDALYDLFMRFTDARVRVAALASLQRMNPSSPYLEPIFERYLDQPEPESKLFAIKGILRLRDEKALPQIRSLAHKKFAEKDASQLALLSERNLWFVQYEALGALAQWKPEEALPLLVKKSAEAPGVALLLGTYLWKDGLPQIVTWAQASSAEDREKAQRALEAPAPLSALRQTREAMLQALRDPKAPMELRHQFALKLGQSSTPAEVDEMLKEHAGLKDERTRTLFAAALFATRDQKVAPLLEEYAKTDQNASTRLGALIQLKALLPPAEFRPLADWVSKNDPDESNRAAAADGAAKLGPARP